MNEDLLVQCSNAVVMLVKSKTEKRRYNKTKKIDLQLRLVRPLVDNKRNFLLDKLLVRIRK